ncbi:hypothetical protein T02_16519 [Trichinella nativa]|uniref:Uncharacterized protein n=1 Tax=Trichinella nativa TaxID=6335 RepID=A0A0V1KQS2_9BILA|nr:hypothetical protein T06_7329 [Trichinella sp. T6]KRZ49704.1 hypothetical protein T02_16519 [Trichinella nativa]
MRATGTVRQNRIAGVFVNSRTHLKFRRKVLPCLLESDSREGTRARLPAETLSHLPDIRYDGINHTLGTATQGRCRVCQRNTKNICQKCNVRACMLKEK